VLRWGLALLAGCGRFGFDSTGGELAVDASPDDGPITGDAVDAMPDAMIDAMIDAPSGTPMTFTFGEAPITMFKTVTRDTYLSNEAGESLSNFGGDDEIRLEMDSGERGLLAFDLSAIATTATITSASLQITNTQIPVAPLPIDMHRVNEQWDEGNGTGAGGIANFSIRTGVTTWSNAGAAPPISASTAFGNFTPVIGLQTIAIPTPVIQSWVTTPATNFGIVMISRDGESTRFTTSEGAPSSARPVLTVTFTP